MFLEVVSAAAADAGAEVSLVEKRSQGRDHPILINVPETYYLKCLISAEAGLDESGWSLAQLRCLSLTLGCDSAPQVPRDSARAGSIRTARRAGT